MTKRPSSLAYASLVATFVASTPQAFAFAEIARGKLTASVNATGSYDTNIFANNTEVDDFTASLSPSLNYTRNVGRISLAAQLSVTALTFADTDGQDSIDPTLSANLTHDRAEKGSDGLSLSYTRASEANDILLDRVESDAYRGSARSDYFYSEKTGIRVEGSYRVTDYVPSRYNDIESYTLGGGLLYAYSPKLVANASYAFNTEVATNRPASRISDPSSDNHNFTVGLEGQIAPKVDGTVGVGYGYRDFDRGNSDGAVLFNAGLTWTASAKTTVSLTGRQGFDTTANAESARTLDVVLGANHSLVEKISLSVFVGYDEAQLNEVGTAATREDEAYNVGVGVSYSMNDYISTSADITHRVTDSTLARAEYDRTVFSVSVTATY